MRGNGVVRRVSSLVSERFAGAVAAPRRWRRSSRRLTDAFQRIGEVVGIMAAITAILAIVGVYGVVALAAKRRLKEMGIRLALGARRADVYRAMVRPNVRPVVVGLIVGALFTTVAAIEADRLLAAEFPVRIVDPIAFLARGADARDGDNGGDARAGAASHDGRSGTSAAPGVKPQLYFQPV